MNATWSEVLSGPAPLVPGVWDGLSARFAAASGFRAILLGGYHAGATVGSAEPLLSAAELIDTCRRIRRATDLPLRVDVGAGYGEPMHVVRLVKDLLLAGVDAISLEDQIYPKRAHYHNDYREELIDLPAMVDKIEWARRAGGEKLYLCARTDAFSTGDFDAVVRRCRVFLEAGADAVQAFPSTMDEARELPRAVGGPIWYANTRGNRVGRPNLTPQQAEEYGYVALADGHALFLAAVRGMVAALDSLSEDTGIPVSDDEIDLKKRVEAALDLDAMYEIEAKTVLRTTTR